MGAPAALFRNLAEELHFGRAAVRLPTALSVAFSGRQGATCSAAGVRLAAGEHDGCRLLALVRACGTYGWGTLRPCARLVRTGCTRWPAPGESTGCIPPRVR